MLLNQIVTESNYGSLIDRDKYDEMDSADQVLYKYTADGFSTLSAQQFKTLEQRYPFSGGTLYRGLFFSSPEDLESFLDSIKDGTVKTVSQSSWSTNKETAEDFAQTVKTYFPTAEIMKAERDRDEAGDHMSGEGGGVLIKIQNAEAGVGIDVNATSYAKESEVLLPPGTYKVEVVRQYRPFRATHSTLDKAQEMIASIQQFNETGEGNKRELEQFATYLEKSFIDKLEPHDIDVLINFRYAKALKLSASDFVQKSIQVVAEKSRWNSEHELRVHVTSLFDFELFSRATPKMQSRILSMLKGIPKNLENELKKYEGEIENFTDFSFYGFDELSQFLPDSLSKATKGLKKSLADLYNKLNSREHNQTLRDMASIRAHAKRMGNLVQSIANLQ